jgi:hypothetical protein
MWMKEKTTKSIKRINKLVAFDSAICKEIKGKKNREIKSCRFSDMRVIMPILIINEDYDKKNMLQQK